MKNEQDTQGFLASFCNIVEEAKIYPLIKFADTFRCRCSGIVNYSNNRITIGTLERINIKK